MNLLHSRPSSHPAGHGITIGTPRFYDLTTGLLFGGLRRRAYRTLLVASRVQPGDRVLDVGCGPGYFVRMLAEAVGAKGSAIGVDAAPEMIDYATRRSSHRANCRFEPGSAESLAFADAAFDVVVSSLMLHHLPEEARLSAVREMRRVLRPGGTLLLAEFQMPERGAWHVIGRLTGHSAMQHRVSPVEPVVADAGFVDSRSGEAPPWLHYVSATNPVLDGRKV